MMFLLVTGWVWQFVPQSWTPPGTLAGLIRFGIAVYLTHAGLILFWPGALMFVGAIFWNLWRRNWWASWFKLAAASAFCLWQAWDSTQGAIWVWKRMLN